MPNRLLDTIRRAALLRDGGGLSDGQLLTLFIRQRDGDAFEALVNRHGSMVMGVCRRVLHNRHDAEDAFQATFLIFSRKAGSVQAQDSIAGWLYRVAYRTALEARARIARRRNKEQQVADFPHPEFEPEQGHSELLALLDKELNSLPDKYRIPVILCELEGRTRREVAHQFGVPEGTISWRLAYAKKLLAKRLSRRGVTLTTVALTAVAEVLSPTLRASTVKAVLTAEAVSANVLALTEGMMRVMLLSKLKVTFCFAAVALVVGIGASGLTYRATAQQPGQGASLESRSQADELEALRLEIEALRKSLQATRVRVKTLEKEMSALKGRTGGSGGMRGSNKMFPSMPGMSGAAPGGGVGALGLPGAGGQPPSDPAIGQLGAPQGQPGNPGSQQVGPPGRGAGGHPGGAGERPSKLPASTGGSDMHSQMMQQMQRMKGPMGGIPGRPQQGQAQQGGPPGGMQAGRPGGGMRPDQGMGGMMQKEPSDPVRDAEAALKKLKAKPDDKKAAEALERALKQLKEREKPDQPGERNLRGR